MSGHFIRYLESGACENENESFIRCAMEPHECSGDGEKFSPHDQDTSIIARCNPNNYKIGRCLKENVCALRSSDCSEDMSDSNFDKDDENCTIQRDHSKEWNVNEPEFTQFGSCYNDQTNEYLCIYNPDHCDESVYEVYKTPFETFAAGYICDCSEVHVWGCMTASNRVMCAVSEEACNQGYEFLLSPIEQRDNRKMKKDTLDCLLCRKRNTKKPTSVPTKEPTPTSSPTKTPTFTPTKYPETPEPTTAFADLSGIQALGTTNTEIKNDSNSGIILVAAFGGFAGVLFILGVIYLVFFKSRNEKEYETSNQKENAPTLKKMEISF